MTELTAGTPVAAAPPQVRTQFMGRVYGHLVGGIAAFVAAQYVLFTTGLAAAIFEIVIATNWLLILGGFMVVSWLATHLARRARTMASAYGAYGLLVLANALLFAAPLYQADLVAPGAISTAAWLSIGAFVGLSVVALTTSRDFSFLRGLLVWGGMVALLAIVGAVLFGAALGTWFSVAMIAFAGAAILYDTQTVYRSFPPHAVVPAAMHLFSSLALLFWYVLRLVMQRR
jgi:uncharacterized protein